MSTWTIDPTHSSVTFAIKHMLITTVHGSFADVVGSVVFDEAHPERSAVEASIGVASFPAPDVGSVDALFARADAALYRAKAAGRNKVCT